MLAFLIVVKSSGLNIRVSTVELCDCFSCILLFSLECQGQIGRGKVETSETKSMKTIIVRNETFSPVSTFSFPD